MSKNCDSQAESRLDRALRKEEAALAEAMAEAAAAAARAAEAQAKAARIYKTVKSLKDRSLQELEETMLELEKEDNEPGDPSSSGGTVVESVPTGDAGVEGDPSSSNMVSEDPLESMSPGSFARWVDMVVPALLVGETSRDYSLS